MNFKKYISRKLILRLLLFLAVVLSAVLFDTFHEGSVKLVNETHQRSDSHDMQAGRVFFYNPVSSFKIRSGADKLFSGLIFAASRNEFLSEYHNCRTFHLLKKEALQERLPFLMMAHFMKFNSSHHSSPDDDPSIH